MRLPGTLLSVLSCRLRSRVAAGETRQPGASNMMELQWDEELARLAQAHADQCKFRWSIVATGIARDDVASRYSHN